MNKSSNVLSSIDQIRITKSISEPFLTQSITLYWYKSIISIIVFCIQCSLYRVFGSMNPYSVIVFHKSWIINSSCSLVIGIKVANDCEEVVLVEDDEGAACALDVFAVDNILDDFTAFDNEENISLKPKS